MMALPNPDVQLTPMHPQEQVQTDEQFLETEQHEDLDDLRDTPSVFNSIIPPTTSDIARHADKPSILSRIARLVRKVVSEETQDLQRVEDGVEAKRNQTNTAAPSGERRTLPIIEPSIPRGELAMSKTTALKSPSRAPASLTNLGKRKRAQRADLYEVEVSPQGSELGEDLTNRTRRGPRRNVKAKPPLTKPKSSKGDPSHHIRLQKGNNVPDLREMETTANAPASRPVARGTVASPIAGEQAKPAAKRGRGRPRKNPHQEPAHESGLAISKKGLTNIAVSNPHASEEVEEEISDLLMNPSPIKVVREGNSTTAAASKQHKLAAKIAQDFEIIEGKTSVDDEEENDDEGNQHSGDEKEVVGMEQEVARPSSSGPRDSIIDREVLKRLRDKASQVGWRLTRKGEPLSLQKNEKLQTEYGMSMDRQLTAMVAGYGNLQKLKTARDKPAFQVAHKNIEENFRLLRQEVDNVLLSIFGRGSGTGSGTEERPGVLTDLYFHTLPQTILAVQNAVQVYDNQGIIETPDLQEVSELVKLLYDLANGAVRQPKELQPKPKSRNSSYQISQPTRSNLPDIRKLDSMISAELRSRETSKRLAEDERLRPERERRRRERDEREIAEFRRKREERRRMQGEHWWDLQNNYFPHPWNEIFRVNIASLEAKSSSWHQEAAARKGKGRQESVELRNSGTYSTGSRHDSEEDVERISMFPQNNINELSPLKSLTDEDMSIFIDCMRYEEAEDKYERAAEQLGRSMDEVFVLARDFQEAMDSQHEHGNYNEAQDEWTYSVWVEKE